MNTHTIGMFQSNARESMKACAAVLVAGILFNLTSVAQQGEPPSGDILIADDSLAGLSFGMGLEVWSHDMWHGMSGYDHPIFKMLGEIAYETEDFGMFYFAPEILFQMGKPRDGNSWGISEVDYIAGWSRDFGPISFDLGHVFYTYPTDRGANMHESFVGISYENPIVTPFLIACYDFSDSRSLYFTGGLRREFDLLDAWTLEAQIDAGMGTSRYNRHYFDEDRMTITDGTAQLSLIYDVLTKGDKEPASNADNRFMYLGLTVGFSTMLDSDIRGNPATSDSTTSLDTLWYGVALGIEF